MIYNILMILGAGFVLTGSFGVLRMPDVYNRIHAQTVCVVGGAGLILIGICLKEGLMPFGFRAVAVAALLFATNAVGSHAIARAARRSGVEPSEDTAEPINSRRAGTEEEVGSE